MNVVRVYHKPAAAWEIVEEYETEENVDELLERFSLLAPNHAAKLASHNRVELLEHANSSVVVLVVTINLTTIE